MRTDGTGADSTKMDSIRTDDGEWGSSRGGGACAGGSSKETATPFPCEDQMNHPHPPLEGHPTRRVGGSNRKKGCSQVM